jgi:hypothetical protein
MMKIAKISLSETAFPEMPPGLSFDLEAIDTSFPPLEKGN